ncbi:flagellar assembly protein FliW [Desulfobaculum bizertense]|uniref:Flagellar assembly factor FliW n=1 Tax=Desulfobaculum bizertense DSM 18034 TaxID=1121442 RepID=A0A1T4W750_9BACT|nr:flagellar assembly protein FliW [Desulfobaculum bizertense]UIJ39043.1 flagellar assembly protein FliW [Desulfobaculum bizertense]SKA72858.1 flagellar assembly factor FliW [Desulfobaculum bizertense DSM 18034]
MADGKEQKVVKTRFGELTVDMERVIHFPRGLIGFEDCKDFSLVQLSEDSPFMLLQSVTHSELGLLVTDPYVFMEEYRVKLGNAEQKILGVAQAEEVAVLVSVSIPQGHPEKTALNLMGPIMINYAARQALQVPQVDSGFPSRFYIHQDA